MLSHLYIFLSIAFPCIFICFYNIFRNSNVKCKFSMNLHVRLLVSPWLLCFIFESVWPVQYYSTSEVTSVDNFVRQCKHVKSWQEKSFKAILCRRGGGVRSGVLNILESRCARSRLPELKNIYIYIWGAGNFFFGSGSWFFFSRLRLLIFFQPAPAPNFFSGGSGSVFLSGSGSSVLFSYISYSFVFILKILYP